MIDCKVEAKHIRPMPIFSLYILRSIFFAWKGKTETAFYTLNSCYRGMYTQPINENDRDYHPLQKKAARFAVFFFFFLHLFVFKFRLTFLDILKETIWDFSETLFAYFKVFFPKAKCFSVNMVGMLGDTNGLSLY